MLDLEFVRFFNNNLKSRGLTVVCAESITAGLLASTIASIEGASAILIGSVVVYNSDFKTKVLGVDAEIIREKTAESIETTMALNDGLNKLYLGASIYISVTGVASEPTDPNYQVLHSAGTVFVVIKYKDEEKVYTVNLNTENTLKRNEIREKAVMFILKEVLGLIDNE